MRLPGRGSDGCCNVQYFDGSFKDVDGASTLITVAVEISFVS